MGRVIIGPTARGGWFALVIRLTTPMVFRGPSIPYAALATRLRSRLSTGLNRRTDLTASHDLVGVTGL